MLQTQRSPYFFPCAHASQPRAVTWVAAVLRPGASWRHQHSHGEKRPKRGRRVALPAVAAAAAVAAPFAERLLAQQERARSRPSPHRPRYIGCTESADVRDATTRALLRTWPGGGVTEFWSVVGGLSGFDSLAALAMSQVQVEQVVLFDHDPVQLCFGELVVNIIMLCPSRELFVQALLGRSMGAWGRLVSASSMLDFLDLPVDQSVKSEMTERLPERLRELYGVVFDCVAYREGWPLVWPSFGKKERLPVRDLPNAKRRLGGGRNESFHLNEAGWLSSEKSYNRVRATLLATPPEFRSLDLADVSFDVPGRRVLFISNIDGSPQFMAGRALDSLRQSLQQTAPTTSFEAESSGVLLLSTKRAEWLPAKV